MLASEVGLSSDSPILNFLPTRADDACIGRELSFPLVVTVASEKPDLKSTTTSLLPQDVLFRSVSNVGDKILVLLESWVEESALDFFNIDGGKFASFVDRWDDFRGSFTALVLSFAFLFDRS